MQIGQLWITGNEWDRVIEVGLVNDCWQGWWAFGPMCGHYCCLLHSPPWTRLLFHTSAAELKLEIQLLLCVLFECGSHTWLVVRQVSIHLLKAFVLPVHNLLPFLQGIWVGLQWPHGGYALLQIMDQQLNQRGTDHIHWTLKPNHA